MCYSVMSDRSIGGVGPITTGRPAIPKAVAGKDVPRKETDAWEWEMIKGVKLRRCGRKYELSDWRTHLPGVGIEPRSS